MNIAINGFGRIGRTFFRQGIEENGFQIVAINASYPTESLAHLIKYDTVHGKFPGKIEVGENYLLVNGQKIHIVNERTPEQLPWEELGIDIVIEATGRFNTKEDAMGHVQAGAKKVILTAPGKNEDQTIVMGVNEHTLDIQKHTVISNASCTTNCLAPVIKVMDNFLTIKSGSMTTVHAYTNDQNNLDNPHKDLRRARACGQSIIPTSTGAAKAIEKVIPHLSGKIQGISLRVPVPNVSLVDVVLDVKEEVSINDINNLMKHASQTYLKGIIDICEEPLVSIDFKTNPHSAIIDSLSTMVIEKRKIKILAWYDNEWGYSSRLIDLTKLVAEKLKRIHQLELLV